jgi:ATP-dependent helicase HrpA
MAHFGSKEIAAPADESRLRRAALAGTPKLDGLFRLWSERLSVASLELDKTLAALKSAAKHPSGRAAILDLEAQMRALVPPDLIAWIPLGQLRALPTLPPCRPDSLGARRARSSEGRREARARRDTLGDLHDAKQQRARDDEAFELREIRWMFEELRVAVFAPELKTPVPVSVKRISDLIAGMTLREV